MNFLQRFHYTVIDKFDASSIDNSQIGRLADTGRHLGRNLGLVDVVQCLRQRTGIRVASELHTNGRVHASGANTSSTDRVN